MIPSQSWFPTNLAARAAWYLNFNTQFAKVAAALDLDGSIAEVEKDNGVMQFIADIHEQLRAFEQAVTQYRKIITENQTGQPIPSFPPMPAFALPFEIPTGMFERLNKLRDKILAADTYTNETGALLGILARKSDSLAPQDVKPTVQAFGSQSNYEFSCVVGGRGASDSWEVLVRRAGQEKWTAAKTATGKSVDVVIAPTTEGKPEQLQIMIQLKKSNANYGQPSDAVYMTVNP